MDHLLPQPDAGQTPLSLDEARELRLNILTRDQLNAEEKRGIVAARQWALGRRVLGRPFLTDAFARELHRRMFKDVWRWAGRYRTREINLDFAWAPHRISEGVRVALDDASYQLHHDSYSVVEDAVRLHHRLVVIHPWVNGNGRHSRLMADMAVASRGAPMLTWGAGLDLIRPGESRQRYLAALHAADQGDFAPLTEFAQLVHAS